MAFGRCFCIGIANSLQFVHNKGSSRGFEGLRQKDGFVFADDCDDACGTAIFLVTAGNARGFGFSNNTTSLSINKIEAFTRCHSCPIVNIIIRQKGKKGKSKKSQKPARSGMEWATSFTLKPFEARSTRDLASTAAASFEGRTGKPLCDELVGVSDIPKALWNAPVACVVLGEESGKNVIRYVNLAALETVGLEPNQWRKLMWNPNPNADNPDPIFSLDLPAEMKEKSYESGYQKKILRRNGSTIENDVAILDALRWKLDKSALVDGKFVTITLGIAYAWREWVVDDTTICSPGGKQRERVDAGDLKEVLDKQASQIRQLKEDLGLGNKDPQVQDAVAELLRLKSLLEASQ